MKKMKFIPVHLCNYRKGLATNSSSTHSIIYRNKGEMFEDLDIFELNYYGRCDSTIAASREAKIKYVLSCIFDNEELVKIMSIKYPEMKEYFPLVKRQIEEGTNSDGYPFFGEHCRGNINFANNIQASFDYLSKIIDDPEIIIVGGSDEQDFVYDTTEGHDEMAMPHELSLENDNVFKNGNYWVGYGYGWENAKYCSAGRIRFNTSDLDEVVPEYPELIDLRITNKCLNSCPMCFMGSGPDGKHADPNFIRSVVNGLGSSKVEFSIGGGNILLYPHLEEVFDYMKEKGHIINVTIKADDVDTLLKSDELKKIFDEYVSGIGVSVFCIEDVQKVNELYDSFEKKDTPIYKRGKNNKHIIAHLIPEYLGVEKTVSIMDALRNEENVDRYIRALFLGYKAMERGANCEYHEFTKEELDRIFKDEYWHNIDTTFANRYFWYIKDNFEYEKSITLNEGEFSMYIDGVEEKAYKSSYHLDKPYNMHMDWKTADKTPWYNVKSAFTNIRKDNGMRVYEETVKHYWN